MLIMANFSQLHLMCIKLNLIAPILLSLKSGVNGRSVVEAAISENQGVAHTTISETTAMRRKRTFHIQFADNWGDYPKVEEEEPKYRQFKPS